MSTTLRRPPDERLWSGHDDWPPHDDDAGPVRTAERPRRRTPLMALLATAALLGGGVSAGVLAATGAVGGGSSTTTVVRSAAGTATPVSAPASNSSSGSRLNASALYASTSPGVVDITSKGISSSSDQSTSPSPFGQAPQQSTSTATGTGFVVDRQGHIVTAAHVVNGASSVTVKLADGTNRRATVLGIDDATDVAVLKIDPSGLTLHPLPLAASSPAIGDAVAAIGDPFGYARSISTGIVSGLDRTIQAPNGFTVAHAIQTDAALNPGNSGGPLLNASGQVIGIVDQIATNGNAEQSSGVGFAVPIAIVRSELSTLQSGGKVRHAYLGVATSDLSTTSGATIASVTAGGPAANAGLHPGDVVTKIGDTTVAGPNDLVAAIAAHRPGDKVTVTVRRGSSTAQTTVTLGTQPAQSTSGG